MKNRLSALICLSILLLSTLSATAEPQKIGSWENRSREERGTISIIKYGKETFLMKKFKSGITVKQPVKISRKGKSFVYRPTNGEVEEYYIVNQDNNLEIWDRLGLKKTIGPEQ